MIVFVQVKHPVTVNVQCQSMAWNKIALLPKAINTNREVGAKLLEVHSFMKHVSIVWHQAVEMRYIKCYWKSVEHLTAWHLRVQFWQL